MATFYGKLTGNRGTATRCGSSDSGIRASLQSYNGSIIAMLTYTDGGELMVEIASSEHSSSSGGLIFYDTFSEFIRMCKEWTFSDGSKA